MRHSSDRLGGDFDFEKIGSEMKLQTALLADFREVVALSQAIIYSKRSEFASDMATFNDALHKYDHEHSEGLEKLRKLRAFEKNHQMRSARLVSDLDDAQRATQSLSRKQLVKAQKLVLPTKTKQGILGV